MPDDQRPSDRPTPASTLNRRRFLAGAVSVSTASVLAGCRDPRDLEVDRTTATPRDPESSNPNRKELLLAPVMPTVALKTDSGRWIPRSVLTGGETGWELALQAGEMYDPGVDRGGSGEGYNPPDWVPDRYIGDLAGNRFFKLPSQLLVSGSPTLEAGDYPSELSLECNCLDLTVRNATFDPTNPDSLGYEVVLRVDGGGERLADEISGPTFSATFGENNRFRDYVDRHPDTNPQTGRITVQSRTTYGAVDTNLERLGSSLGFGFEELLKLYVTSALRFKTGASIITKGLFPTLVGELEGRVYDLAFGGSVEATTAVAIFNAVATEDGWKRPENVDSQGLSSAGAIDGTLFLPPMNDSMRDEIDSVSYAQIPEYDVTIVDSGLGLSGPMLYLADPAESDGGGEVVYDVSLDPTATYLRTYNDDAADPAIIPLDEIGAQPGDQLKIEVLGDYTRGGVEDIEQSATIAVFSSSDRFLGDCGVVDGDYECATPEDPRRRVPDAIGIGRDFETKPTYYSEKPTDIPEDFAIDGSVTVTVPDGAEYLFVAPHDDHYQDNRDADGDYTVRIYPPDS